MISEDGAEDAKMNNMAQTMQLRGGSSKEHSDICRTDTAIQIHYHAATKNSHRVKDII